MTEIADKVLPVCDICRKPIIKRGGIDIDASGPLADYHAWRKFEIETNGQLVPISDCPDMVTHHWRLAHWNCTGNDDTYWIEWNRINSPEKAMGWTAHLSEKVWFSHTDWFDLMTRLGYLVYD